MIQKKHLGIISIILIISLLLLSVVFDKNKTYKEDMTEDGETAITVTIPKKVYVVNEAIVEWINGTDNAKVIHDKYRSYGRLDYTKTVSFLYSIDNLPLDAKVENQYVTVFDKDYSKEVYSTELSPEKRSVNIDNLRPDTVYEYNIRVEFSDGKKLEKKGEFKTEPSPCFLFVDGIRNVRDIGNIKTADGKKIKKYMVYRGSELDGAIEPSYVITKDGINYMKDVLNIKNEVDLRWHDEKTMKDTLGTDVIHKYYTIPSYNDFFEKSYSSVNTKMLFSDLANPDMYPIYVHCSYGADRTGTVMYVLEALLGLDEETLYQEWEASLFCHSDSFYDEMEEFIKRFKKLPGNTMQEKAENYLLSIGVTKQEIDSIREILLTD